MNLILLFSDDFIDDGKCVRLSGRRFEHVRKVHRVAVGDELCVGLCGGLIGTGRVTVLNEKVLEMNVAFRSYPPLPLPVTLALALPRPIMLKRVLASATSMGVKRIILFHSHRVEKSFWKSPALNEAHIKEQLILGLEQAKDTLLPTVELKPLFKPFVEDDLPAMAKDTLCLVAHPESADPCPSNVAGPVTLVVGPEGGLIPYEIEKLRSLGFLSVHLGKRILRVETAVPALLSKLF
ncbi:MAG TPA: 16S rRNA (uracil(1498)-N(3))-methyltransferase [Candidatus Omnitrophota bacterium]|nr:16S rRNA (uracil(1498)-N(3))-methyltransferase [Candidatus Omnitrophota bacterium]